MGKAKQQIALARFIGKMAVDQGAKQLRERLSPAPVPPERSPAPQSVVEVVPVAAVEPAQLVTVGVEVLALPDYDQLPAAHIVGKLEGLTQSERDNVELYEAAGRHRRTVLGKLDQLRKV
jgi:hypothetical protein